MSKILLLEDDDALRLLLAELLEDEGHEVVQSADGLAAFDLDLIKTIDLMITDLYMPSVDGMTAILSARRDRPDLKIVAMSGGGEFVKTDFLPHTRKFGASGILQKPFLPAEFRRTVRAALAVPAHLGDMQTDKAMAS